MPDDLTPAADLGIDAPLDDLSGDDRPVPCARIIGVAGSGKSYTLRQRAAETESVLIGATTGVAAVNAGSVTINSLLSYFDLNSLRDNFLTGQLARKLHDLVRDYRTLAIEEYSMLDADALDYIYRGVVEANRYQDVAEPLGILLVGDLAQLPPIKAKWCFEASCWKQFADNTERLTHVWRQDQGPFLDALNHVRLGNGMQAAEVLSRAGARWHTALDTEFDGTTILPKNAMVSRYNELGLARVKGDPFTVTARRWGQQRPEWGENARTHEWGIPPRVQLKIGAYVMCLSNNTFDFSVVNGDCGYVTGYSAEDRTIMVRLVRTGVEQPIRPICRAVEASDVEDFHGPRLGREDDRDGQWLPEVHYRGRTRRYVTGQVEFYPLRLSYATTVHKSQSLTLDKVQVDFRDHFFGNPAMLYVAMSRCRTLGGLRLVGGRDRFVKQCNMDRRILPWI